MFFCSFLFGSRGWDICTEVWSSFGQVFILVVEGEQHRGSCSPCWSPRQLFSGKSTNITIMTFIQAKTCATQCCTQRACIILPCLSATWGLPPLLELSTAIQTVFCHCHMLSPIPWVISCQSLALYKKQPPLTRYCMKFKSHWPTFSGNRNCSLFLIVYRKWYYSLSGVWTWMPVGNEDLFPQSNFWWRVGRMQAFLSACQVEKEANRHTFSNVRISLEKLGKRAGEFQIFMWYYFHLCCSWYDIYIFPFAPLSLIHMQRWKKICSWMIYQSATQDSVLLADLSSNVTCCIIPHELLVFVQCSWGWQGGGVGLPYQQCKFYCTLTWGFKSLFMVLQSCAFVKDTFTFISQEGSR